MSKVALRIYGHYVSQPSRAVLWTLKMKEISFEFTKIDPMKKQTEDPSFLESFPLGAIPTMDHSGFRLEESNAILLYLAEVFQWTDLVPPAVQPRAMMHKWLHWHHHHVRTPTQLLFRQLLLRHSVSEGFALCSQGRQEVGEALDVLSYASLNKTAFLVGGEATLADIAVYCELDQLEILELMDFKRWPLVEAWMARMKQLPFHDDVRRSLLKLKEKTVTAKVEEHEKK